MSQPRTGEPAPGTGGERGVGELLLAALAGSALAPFVQAIATKVGEDVYAKVRHLLTRRRRGGPEPVAGTTITLADPATAVVLELPAKLSTDDATSLAAIRLPGSSPGKWLLVRHDADMGPGRAAWAVIPIDEPPADAVEIGDPEN